MDPYLESHWPDVQTSLVTTVADRLNRDLPDDLVARAGERDAVEGDGDDQYVLREPMLERWVRIIEFRDDRLITAVEFVSPATKQGKGLEAFVAAREEMLSKGVNVVEIDLTRSGDWKRLMRPHDCPPAAVTPYRVLIRGAREAGVVSLYPIRLCDPLPVIPIPLRRDENPALLRLGELLRIAYDTRRYGRTLDYTQAPIPPLEGEDADWADQLLREAGRRK
jgi:hypothetical protein